MIANDFQTKAIMSKLVASGYDVVDMFCFVNNFYKSNIFTIKLKYNGTFLYTRVSDINDFDKHYHLFCSEIEDCINEANNFDLDDKNSFYFIANSIVEKHIIQHRKDIYFPRRALEDISQNIFNKSNNIIEVLKNIETKDYSFYLLD